MNNIKAFCRTLKEKFQARSRRRRMFNDAMFLIRLQQMDASVAAYIRDLESKVGTQAREIREMGAKIQNMRLAAIDAELYAECRRYVRLPYQVTRIAKKPPIKTMLTIGTLLTGCVFSAPEQDKIDTRTMGRGPAFSQQADPVFPCTPSCVLEWKFIEKIPLAPGDSVKHFDTKGDTLLTYRGYTEDGRDYWFSRAEYDSLEIGEAIPGCVADPKILCAE